MLMHDITTCMQGHGSCGLGLGPWDCVHFLLCYYCVPLLVCNVALWHMGLLHWQAQKKHPDYFLPPAHTRKRVREREREKERGGGAARENWPYVVYGWFGPYVFGEQLKASAFLRVLGIWCHRGGQVPQKNTHDLSFIAGLERTHLCR